MITLEHVTKKYKKKAIAINDLSLTISDNGIYCLVGKNGAGKTTFMKLISGYIGASAGEVRIAKQKVSPSKMPEIVNFIESGCEQFNMKIVDLIETAALLQDDFDKEFAYKMAERFKLNLQKKYKSLSFGMTTMLTTILTLANNSPIILLDEPTLGFDAVMREQFNELVLESYQQTERIIIISTHLIDEIAKIAQKLIIINQGTLVLQTDINDIDEYAYTLAGPTEIVGTLLTDLNCLAQTTVAGITVGHIYDKRITPPVNVRLSHLSAQDFFITISGGTDYN